MKRAVVVSVLMFAAPVAMAQETLTKDQVVARSGAICRDLLDATLPHVRKMRRADGPNGFIRHGRRFVRESRPYVRDLRDLPEPETAVKYRRFVNNTWEALDLLDKAFNALEAGRGNLAERRANESGDQAQVAKQAAKRYGLRDSCITYVS